MQKVARQGQWICSKCLKKQLRYTSTAAAASSASRSTFDSTFFKGSSSKSDDHALQKVFNDHAFWQDFSRSAKKSSGLVGNRYLTTPRGFQAFAEASLAQCKKLVNKTLAASSHEAYLAIPRDLDRLSDLLCRVIDLSDFIRSNHPDPRIASAAAGSYAMMYQYMNELNTTTGLNGQLKLAWSMPDVRSRWNDEEKIVAQILMKDFAKSGIDLPENQRERFVSLSNDIAQIGTDFTNQMEPARPDIPVSPGRLDGLDPTVLKNLPGWKKARIPVYSSISKMIMSSVHDSETRKELYVAERTASKRTIARLEQLLLKRAELAKLTGYSNYATMTLADKMAKRPEAVSNFMQSLNDSNKGQIHNEIAELLNAADGRGPAKSSSELMPWDHSYLLRKLYQRSPTSNFRTSKSRLYEKSKAYFSLGNVMQGLSKLFQSLYGVRFVPQQAQLGEVWDDQVRRLDAYTEKNEHIATMYCDLFTRAGKPPNPAHFTLVCSREISEEEVQDAFLSGQPLNNGMPTLITTDPASGKTQHFQIPTIALVCDFPNNSNTSEPSLLSLHSVITLFHEMGHAIHSILGRTTLQGISGTRCPTDFAELPSILMEYFAVNPEVLKLFARHWQTDELIPDDMIRALKSDQKDRAEKTGGWDNENQILMAMLDQSYHAGGPIAALESGEYDSTAAYHQIWDMYGSFEEPRETAWQGFFGHLYGYGATYYAYLFDRAIARQVWRAVFKDGDNAGAIDRAAGQRFRDDVLQWGGGRDPWWCLENLMGQGRGVLADGGEAAMLEVGKWGIDAGTEGQM